MANTSPSEPEGFYIAPFALVPAWVIDRLMDKPPEVLRFYCWLNVRVIGQDRSGYKKVAEMAEALGVGERTVKRWVGVLVEVGAVRVQRFRRRSGQLGQNVYYCPKDEPGLFEPATTGHPVTPGPDQGEPSTRGHGVAPDQGSPRGPSINPDTNSFTQIPEALRASGAALRAAEQPPLIPDDEIVTGEVVDDRPLPAVREQAAPPAVTAQSLLATMIDGLATRSIQLPATVKARWGKEFKRALDEGFPPEVVMEAVRVMFRENALNHPTWLPQVLVRVQTGPTLPPERMNRVDAAQVRRAQDAGRPGSDPLRELFTELGMSTGGLR